MEKNRYWTDLARHGPAVMRRRLAETAEMLAFLTILPLRRDGAATADFTVSLRAMPLAGAAIGLLSAAVTVVASALHLPALLTATLTVAATVALTGALHEDALSDVADGFGGGRTRERKLEIMRDSRLGTYGAAALALSLLIRIAALAGLLAAPGALSTAIAAIIAAAILSRTACVAILAQLAPARSEGLGAGAGTPDSGTLNESLAVAAAVAGLVCILATGMLGALLALAAAASAAWGMIALARAQIGGQTGDVAGAGQQAVECAVLVAIAAAAGL